MAAALHPRAYRRGVRRAAIALAFAMLAIAAGIDAQSARG